MLQQIIDRRLSGKNKSIGNRERFLRRYKTQIRDAVRKAVDKRGIRDIERSMGDGIKIVHDSELASRRKLRRVPSLTA